MKRKHFLSFVGGGTVLAAATATGLIANRSTKTALILWENAAPNCSDPRKRALSWAILAPNPHNRQPWMVDLSEPNRATLYVDTTRMLPQTDPFNRQITIGLGCFIEMAAAQDGITLRAEHFPDGSDESALDDRPIAILYFEGDAAADPLFAFVPERRSLKESYDIGKEISQSTLWRGYA